MMISTAATPPSFADRFSTPLPRGLREQAGQMCWDSFVAAYGHTPGPVRLGQWACVDAERPASRLGPRPRTYRATIAVGDRIETSTVAASGPLAALSEMLFQHGIAVEMLRFHQLQSDNHTATFIEGSDGFNAQWAMGWSANPMQSALSAIVTCANRLLSHRGEDGSR